MGDILDHREQSRMWSCFTVAVPGSPLPPVSPSTVNLLGSQGAVLG